MTKKNTTASRPLVNLMGTNTTEPVTKITTDANQKPMDKKIQKPAASKKK